MATLKDVASAVGVSVTTVSYAMTGRGSVSAPTRRRVRLAAQKLGYSPNRAAQAIRTGRTGSIGLILHDFTQPASALIAQRIERAARARSCLTIMIDAVQHSEDTGGLLELLLKQGVDGVVWALGSRPVKVPEHLHLVVMGQAVDGMDSIHWNPQHVKKQGEAALPHDLMATEAVELLLERIDAPDRATRSIVLGIDRLKALKA